MLQKILDNALGLIVLALISPLLLGLITDILFKDFLLGAGCGMFVIIGAMIVFPILTICDNLGDK